jgi:hypothetical protein
MSRDGVAGLKNWVEIATHVSNASDAVRKKQRKYKIASIAFGAIEVDVCVHIPKTGDQVLAFGVDGLPPWRCGPVPDTYNSIAFDAHCGLRTKLAADDVDHVCIDDSERLRLPAVREQK